VNHARALYAGHCSTCKEERRATIELPSNLQAPGVIGFYCVNGQRRHAHAVVLTYRGPAT
jgi:hypothetical protein